MRRSGIRWDLRVEVGLLLLVGVVLGACREFLFINLNYQIDHVARHTRFSYAHSLFQGWTRGMELDALLTLKWLWAAAFMVLMAGLCVLLARVLSGSWGHARPIVGGFVLFALLALATHGLARWQPRFETVSIQLAHMLQYPVVLLFVLLAAGSSRVKASAG